MRTWSGSHGRFRSRWRTHRILAFSAHVGVPRALAFASSKVATASALRMSLSLPSHAGRGYPRSRGMLRAAGDRRYVALVFSSEHVTSFRAGIGVLLWFSVMLLTPRVPGGTWTNLAFFVAVVGVSAHTFARWTTGTVHHMAPAGPEDETVEAVAVLPNGERRPISVMVRRHGGVPWMYETWVRPPPKTRLDLGEFRPVARFPTS